MKNLGEAVFRPGILRLFLAATVVFQHARLCALGAWAVDVFFILSGYWVCRMWCEKYRARSHPLAIFFTSRFWRLWPSYFVCTAIGIAVFARFSPRWGTEAAWLTQPAWLARMLLIASAGSQFTFVQPIWSLDIELQFYFVLPVLAWGFSYIFRLPPLIRHASLTLLLAALAAIFIRFGPTESSLRLLPTYLVFFALGMVTFFAEWKPSRRVGLGSVALIAALLAVMVCHPVWRGFLGAEATRTSRPDLVGPNVLLCGLLAILATPHAAHTFTQSSPALDRHFGNISYVLYLFHYPVQQAMDWTGHALASAPMLRGLIQLAVVTAGTITLYRCVDLPCEHWRHAVLEKRRGLPA